MRVRRAAPCRRARSSGHSVSACSALPIRLVVVSWPALSRKMHWCRSSVSRQRRSPRSSPRISRVSTSVCRVARRAAALVDEVACRYAQHLDHRAVAGGSRAPGVSTGSSAPRIASDQRAQRAALVVRHAEQVADDLDGNRAGVSRRSGRPGRAPTRSSSRRSTSATSPGSIAAMCRCDSAPTIARRTRVCSGGSLNTRLVV